MGKQVRFYALPKDEVLFWEFVRAIPGTYRLSSKSPNSSVSSFVIPWSEKLPKPEFRKYYFCSVKPDSLNAYVKKGSYKVYSEEKMDYIDTGEQFYWLDINAPVIEFISSFFRDDGRLARGRIWADFNKLEGNELVDKGQDLEALFETVAKWIRKNFKRIKGIDGYFGPEALVWYEGGGKIL